MRIFSKTTTLLLLMSVVAVNGFSQKPSKRTPSGSAQNLIRGGIGPYSTSNNWANYSLLVDIPGSALFPLTSSTTVFYLGFTAGTEADISNMVLYSTPHGSKTISAVTPVTLGGASNPSIILANSCSTPISTTNPCVIRLDPTSLTLSPASDYYLTVFFANNSNNQALGGTVPFTTSGTSMSGAFVGATDETHLSVGQSIPVSTNGGSPYFLMYVMSN